MIKRLIFKEVMVLKTINVSFVLFLILLMFGCNSEQKTTDIYMYPDNIPPYIKMPEDIVDTHGKLENKERFDEFLLHVQQGVEDHIRVVKYTEEGAPILYDYDFKKEILNVTIDTRRDGFGQRDIFQTTCTSVIVDEATKGTSYKLKGCNPKIEDNVILFVGE